MATQFKTLFPQPKEVKKTVLTHCLQLGGPKIGTFKLMDAEMSDLEAFERIVYIGNYDDGSDLFLCYTSDEPWYPYTYKGVKGDEFDNL